MMKSQRSDTKTNNLIEEIIKQIREVIKQNEIINKSWKPQI